ncbi:JAB domain-containing protein [Candidatus Magnetaquicoccus inordinatus]|uniref:JAB domain-containing protein n=1 Tax=Candidatus Magnetaquicoccus inordinatus TaxID=2496818 RepID=UPI001D0E805C|nr:DNA repair protein RadC [Candidatus Magnetaquicoccus inordinatus]
MEEMEKVASIHRGHRERLRQRFLQEGLEQFEDHQVLELLLFNALPRQDTNRIAHLLLQRYGCLSAVLEADARDLASVPGMGNAAAAFLAMIPSLTRRYLHDNATREKVPLNDPYRTSRFLIPLMAGRSEEVFYALCLDNRCQLLFPALITRGTVTDALIHPRQVVETILRHKSVNVILAHNHPSGVLQASQSDVNLTLLLQRILLPMGIRLVDHVIVAGEKSLSMATMGFLGEQRSGEPGFMRASEVKESDWPELSYSPHWPPEATDSNLPATDTNLQSNEQGNRI